MKNYKSQISPPEFHYEPDIEDIRVDEDKGWHFPLWVLEELIKLGEFEQALKVNKVNLPGTFRLTKNEYDRIMKEIELRKTPKEKKLVGNVSGSTKQS
jgi:hypothetical protein